jgi:hypothetical protein
LKQLFSVENELCSWFQSIPESALLENKSQFFFSRQLDIPIAGLEPEDEVLQNLGSSYQPGNILWSVTLSKEDSSSVRTNCLRLESLNDAAIFLSPKSVILDNVC